jgi:actin-related protein 3
MSKNKKALVIDNGTGFTKMGFSGNLDPDFVFPTAIAEINKKSDISISSKTDEFDFYIGDKALEVASNSQNHSVTYPMANGMIDKWDQMEKFWHQSMYHYMKVDPQQHNVVLVKNKFYYFNVF